MDFLGLVALAQVLQGVRLQYLEARGTCLPSPAILDSVHLAAVHVVDQLHLEYCLSMSLPASAA